MKKLLAIGLLVFTANAVMGQTFGNEWINYTRPYWSFKIASTGLFRIDSTALANAGFPVGTVDPRDIQLFGRERQVPLYAEGEDDGVFQGTDFIEFYAERNDGWLDVLMHDAPQHQANPYYSLINDTIRYYLTYDAAPQTLRVKPYTNTDYSAYSPRPWFITDAVLSLASPTVGYQIGDRDISEATNSWYVKGEGHFNPGVLAYGPTTTGPVFLDLSVETRFPYTGTGAPEAGVRVHVAGINNPGSTSFDDHHLLVKAGPGLPTLIDTVYRGYQLNRLSFTLPGAQVGSPNTTTRIEVLRDLFDTTDVGFFFPSYIDRQAPAMATVRYAREPNYAVNAQCHMAFPDEPGDPPIRLDMVNFPGSPVVYVFNGDTARRVLPQSGPGGLQALLPSDPTSDTTRAFVLPGFSIQNITVLRPVAASGYFTDHAAMPTDSAMLIVTHPSLMSAAMQYAAHRESSPSNPYNTVLADVEELYDQYGGGIAKHPMSIRRWAGRLLSAWDEAPPQALFLIGKSVQAPRLSGTLDGHRGSAVNYAKCLVPTLGYPPSDNNFTLGLGGDPRMQDIPVGRLAAVDELQVLDYLDKVQVMEGRVLPEPWMKNIVHFRGGQNLGEYQQFETILAEYRAIAEDTCFAGHVTTFRKQGSGVLEPASADSVRSLIEEGVTLMTFFAHATGGGFDIDIDDVANYQWNGRYPMIIGNSCYNGNIHLPPSFSYSEQMTLRDDAGALAFLASVDLGFTDALRTYTRDFYTSFSQENYGRSIGRHMKTAAFKQLDLAFTTRNLNNVQTFTLHGDPTLRLNSYPFPDFRVVSSDIRFDPVNVTADLDSFQVRVAVTNIGKGTYQPFAVNLVRTLQSGTALPAESRALSMAYVDTAVFNIPVLSTEGGLGNNQFQVRVDLDPDEITEMVEVANNIAGQELRITSGDIIPAHPYKFAILPDPAPVLKASTVDPFAPVQTYTFQIDTTDTYDSPVMQSTTITAPGGVVEWQPGSIYALNALQDSLVFFWRVSPVPAPGDSLRWNESSFQHLSGKRGWGQAHFFQYKDNSFSNIQFNRPQRRLDFFSGQRQIRCRSVGNSAGDQNKFTQWWIDLILQESNGCTTTPAFHVAVVDPGTFEAWGTRYLGDNPNNNFGNANDNTNCKQRVEYMFIFRFNDEPQLAGMLDMLQNRVPDGHYVLVYTWRYMNRFASMTLPSGPALFNHLNSMGASSLPTMNDSVPYIFFVRKGFTGTAQEVVGTSINDDIFFSVDVDVLGNRGRMITPRTGPAMAWEALYWHDVTLNTQDSSRIKVVGVRPDNTQLQLIDLPSELDSLPDLESYADAAQFPSLRLDAYFADDSTLAPDPSKLRRWQLLCDPAPECAIDPPSGYFNAMDGIYAGLNAEVAVAVRNISDVDMDSLLMAAWVTNASNVRKLVHYHRRAPLPVGGVLLDTIRFNTLQFPGANRIRIEANPVDTLTGYYDQPEQYHFNNVAELDFSILVDEENPVLDVTFDGVHIMDGDVVSARPEVQIRLDDENTILLLNSPGDTAVFNVYLTGPDGQTRRIYFTSGGQQVLEFFPATGTDNICRILYRPSFTQDGKYTLQVQARDLSNNRSGDHDYKARFEVINRPTISEVINYPNPFTTNTRFVFTVTGSEPPSYMKIQIMTISGRVVREIKMHELGPIRVGRNITEFAWDGTDEFGDKLARGVYIYRVIAQLHGMEIEYRETSAGGYFQKGFGKMYLLR
ncbi:MAG: hypothetical protein JNM31_11725 [Flavobacteriales bacterium]|nr:hypothetical protein [Flavobacteriales bacterium]